MGQINDNLHIDGNFSCKAVALRDKQIAQNMVVHRFVAGHKTDAGSDVTSFTVPVHLGSKPGNVHGVEMAAVIAPSGGDKKVTVDVKKGSQGSAFATILSGTFEITSSHANLQRLVATLAASPTPYSAGDVLEIVGTVSGSTGSQAKGLLITVHCSEDPV